MLTVFVVLKPQTSNCSQLGKAWKFHSYYEESALCFTFFSVSLFPKPIVRDGNNKNTHFPYFQFGEFGENSQNIFSIYQGIYSSFGMGAGGVFVG